MRSVYTVPIDDSQCCVESYVRLEHATAFRVDLDTCVLLVFTQSCKQRMNDRDENAEAVAADDLPLTDEQIAELEEHGEQLLEVQRAYRATSNTVRHMAENVREISSVTKAYEQESMLRRHDAFFQRSFVGGGSVPRLLIAFLVVLVLNWQQVVNIWSLLSPADRGQIS